MPFFSTNNDVHLGMSNLANQKAKWFPDLKSFTEHQCDKKQENEIDKEYIEEGLFAADTEGYIVVYKKNAKNC